MCEVSLSLSCHGTSADTQHDLLSWVLDQARSFDHDLRSYIKNYLPGRNVYVSMRLGARDTVVLRISLYLSSSKFICYNV